MNAPIEIPPPARRIAAISALSESLWREGRSIAGIQLEIQQRFGLQTRARRVWRRIQKRRERDPSIPPPLFNGNWETFDLEDQRADLTPQWEKLRRPQTGQEQGPWDGEEGGRDDL